MEISITSNMILFVASQTMHIYVSYVYSKLVLPQTNHLITSRSNYSCLDFRIVQRRTSLDGHSLEIETINGTRLPSSNPPELHVESAVRKHTHARKH